MCLCLIDSYLCVSLTQFLIDASFVPSDTNISLKIFEKLSKYKDLEIEVIKVWYLKTATVPVDIGALGVVAKTAPIMFRRSLELRL